MRWASGLACCVLAAACSGKSGGSQAGAKSKVKAGEAKVSAAKADKKADPVKAEPQPPPATPEPVAEATPDPTAPAAADRGERFADPPWFRKTMFPDATSVDFNRSGADNNGLFSSQLLFDLKEGTTAEDCAKVVEEKVSGSVKDLTREEADGRITIKGDTDRFKLIMICGAAKGVMKAYVSYQWTS